MLKNWLEEHGVLVMEKENKVNFSFKSANYSLKREDFEKMDIHESIEAFDQITSALGIKG